MTEIGKRELPTAYNDWTSVTVPRGIHGRGRCSFRKWLDSRREVWNFRGHELDVQWKGPFVHDPLVL
jgi:hypothetical protein